MQLVETQPEPQQPVRPPRIYKRLLLAVTIVLGSPLTCQHRLGPHDFFQLVADFQLLKVPLPL